VHRWLILLAACAPQSGLPAEPSESVYVGRDTCTSCHAEHAASHAATYHHTMTQAATRHAVLAPFAGERLGPWHMREAEGTFMAGDERIVMTTGSHHQQAYWFRDASGVLKQLPWVWLVKERRWIENAASFLVDPRIAKDAGQGRWDDNCYRCHATGWDRAEASTADHAPSRDLGISCEACHGAGRAHAERNRNPLRRWWLYVRGAGDDTIVHPGKLDAARSAAVCAQCHSESLLRSDPGKGFHLTPFPVGERHEARFLARAPMQLGKLATEHDATAQRLAGAFWPDGTARVAGREHSAMLLSKCFTKGGMSCVSCHSMHYAPKDKQVFTAGDAMCTQCHEREASAAHTHHALDSSGSRCASCHMPRVTYGLLEARSNHRFDAPTASGARTNDRPNACNLCHVDKSLAWTERTLASWSGATYDAAVMTDERPAAVVWALSGDAAKRAVTAWHLGWPPARAVSDTTLADEALLILLDDPYAAVRHIAQARVSELQTELSVTGESSYRGLSRDESPVGIQE
jgi:predicted CXXCH cytochrome family protein